MMMMMSVIYVGILSVGKCVLMSQKELYSV